MAAAAAGAAPSLARGRYGVHLVDEQHRWRARARGRKHARQTRLARTWRHKGWGWVGGWVGGGGGTC
jgi:hypothetical protein